MKKKRKKMADAKLARRIQRVFASGFKLARNNSLAAEARKLGLNFEMVDARIAEMCAYMEAHPEALLPAIPRDVKPSDLRIKWPS